MCYRPMHSEIYMKHTGRIQVADRWQRQYRFYDTRHYPEDNSASQDCANGTIANMSLHVSLQDEWCIRSVTVQLQTFLQLQQDPGPSYHKQCGSYVTALDVSPTACHVTTSEIRIISGQTDFTKIRYLASILPMCHSNRYVNCDFYSLCHDLYL